MWLLLSLLLSSSSLLVGIVIDMIVCCDYCAVYDDKQCDDGGGIYFVGWQRMMTKNGDGSRGSGVCWQWRQMTKHGGSEG